MSYIVCWCMLYRSIRVSLVLLCVIQRYWYILVVSCHYTSSFAFIVASSWWVCPRSIQYCLYVFIYIRILNDVALCCNVILLYYILKRNSFALSCSLNIHFHVGCNYTNTALHPNWSANIATFCPATCIPCGYSRWLIGPIIKVRLSCTLTMTNQKQSPQGWHDAFLGSGIPIISLHLWLLLGRG